MPDGAMAADATVNHLLDRLPLEVARGLSAEQRDAIAGVLAGRAGTVPPINLRFSIPLLGWRFFFAVMVGHDRRSAERREVERRRHPLHTAGNFLFVLASAMGLYLVALSIFLIWSSVVEF